MRLQLTGRHSIILLFVYLYLSVATVALAQEPGRIYGKVTDWQGKPSTDCEVILEHRSWHDYQIVFTRVQRTSSTGGYSFDQLPRGLYTLRFKVPNRPEKTTTEYLGVLLAGPAGHESPKDLNKEVSVSIGPEAAPKPLATPSPKASPSSTPRPTPRLTPTATPREVPTVTPNELPTPLPESKIDILLARMEFGNIAFNIPPAMVLNKVEPISLLLSKKRTVQEIQKRLQEEGLAGDIQISRIRVHDKMQAIITGDGFAPESRERGNTPRGTGGWPGEYMNDDA